VADGTEFSIDIACRAEGVDTAAALVAKLGEKLTSAGAASTAAADALRAGEASYRSAETAADRTAKALEKISVAAEAQKAKVAAAVADGGIFSKPAQKAAEALAKMEKAQADAAAKAAAAKTQLVSEATALDKLKASATSAAGEQTKLSKTLEEAKKAAKAADDAAAEAAGSGNAKKTAKAFGDIGGPLGSLAQKFFNAKDTIEDFGETLGEGGPYALAAAAAVAVVASIAAISAAAIAGIISIGAWAVGLSDAARSNRLLAQGIAQSVDGGNKLDKAITSLGNSVPLTRDELTQMASDLAKTGLQGKALSDALENAATEAAKAKFGPDWQKQMLSIDNQTARLKTGFFGLFSGLKIEGLLEQLNSLVKLFNENDAAGRAIKVVFESLFQPLVDGLASWIPKARAAFLQFEILALKALIAIKPFGSTILKVAEVIGVVAAVIVGVFLIAIVAIIANLAILAFAFGVIVTAILAVGYGIVKLGQFFLNLSVTIGGAVIDAYNFVVDTFNQVMAFLSGISLSQIGTDMINGLIDGIKGAAGSVVTAVTGVVGGAVTAAKQALGIASPSKVFAEIGMNTGAGMQAGVEDSTADVHGALENMAAPPATALEGIGGAAKPATPASADSGGGSGVQAVFNFYGVAGAEDAQDLFTKALEGYAAQLGAQVPG
jgi:hypothetical protein